jgi:23S rRNA pseudouridine1911/1915/1917 synthase
MSNKLTYIVTETDDMKLRDYLKNIKKLSSRLLRNTSINKKILLNDSIVKLNVRVKLGDTISIDIDKVESQNITPEKMNIVVVFEDEDIIAVNKPFNMVVHPTKSYQNGTLANGLLYYFKEKGENCIVRLVNRLDMDTSGLVLIAKNQFSHMALSKCMENKRFEKHYIAIIHGHMPEKKGTIDLPIYRVGEGTIKRVIDDRGQRSITHYEVLESFKDAEMIKLTLETGRTHQIRVHLSFLSHPIIGDSLYGDTEDSKLISRQALHACEISFPHPRTDKEITLKTDLPEDISNLIKLLKC